jgi:geranylgeranyl diphosphate synthase type II
MDTMHRIESALAAAIATQEQPQSPPKLAAALRYAVFPGGARIRPRLCLAAAVACGDRNPGLADAAAASIELLHCASLVHDDLPCFDDAALRRGKPSVHAMFDERLAVLAGDALIVLAFETLASAAAGAAENLPRLPRLLTVVSRSVGMPSGIVAGQAWECEPRAPLAQYQRAKTGALFAAATQAGALAAGADPQLWNDLGQRLGEAYQVADDIHDVVGDVSEIGKPTGRDAALGRPSAARELGMRGALTRFQQLVQGALDAVPPCAGADELRGLILMEARRLIPEELSRLAA